MSEYSASSYSPPTLLSFLLPPNSRLTQYRLISIVNTLFLFLHSHSLRSFCLILFSFSFLLPQSPYCSHLSILQKLSLFSDPPHSLLISRTVSPTSPYPPSTIPPRTLRSQSPFSFQRIRLYTNSPLLFSLFSSIPLILLRRLELKSQIEAAVRSRKLAHLIKGIRKGKAKQAATQLREWIDPTVKAEQATEGKEEPILMIVMVNNPLKRKGSPKIISIEEMIFSLIRNRAPSVDPILISVQVHGRH
ncbi:hypothetical protein Tco_0014350 [Tanacetum coccineum]